MCEVVTSDWSECVWIEYGAILSPITPIYLRFYSVLTINLFAFKFLIQHTVIYE